MQGFGFDGLILISICRISRFCIFLQLFQAFSDKKINLISTTFTSVAALGHHWLWYDLESHPGICQGVLLGGGGRRWGVPVGSEARAHHLVCDSDQKPSARPDQFAKFSDPWYCRLLGQRRVHLRYQKGSQGKNKLFG